MLDSQALDRVHRLGQERPVKVFRYVVKADKSIEQVCLDPLLLHAGVADHVSGLNMMSHAMLMIAVYYESSRKKEKSDVVIIS